MWLLAFRVELDEDVVRGDASVGKRYGKRVELAQYAGKLEQHGDLLGEREAFFATVFACRLVEEVVQRDHLGDHHGDLHLATDMDSLGHDNVVAHFVELDAGQLGEERLDRIARYAVVVHDAAQIAGFRLLILELAVEQGTELLLEVLAVVGVPWFGESLTFSKLILLHG